MKGIVSSEDERNLREEQISLMVTRYYEKFDFLHYESLNVLIEKTLELFLDSDLTIDEINEKLVEAIAERKKELEKRYDSAEVRKNHETIYGKLELLVRELNKAGVDYQLAGALCGYLKYGKESDRCHDDIDICLNEEDLSKFREICSKIGLSFEDNRFDSPRVLKNGIPSGEHEVIAREDGSDFHVGVFPFRRKEDGSIVMRGYYHDEKGTPCVREEEYSPELAKEIYGQEETDFRGTPLRITPPEHLYLMKKYTNNQKDQHDVAFLEERIDKDKLKKIQGLSHTDKVVRYGPVPASELVSTQGAESLAPAMGNGGNSELSSMFVAGDDSPKKMDMPSPSKTKEGEKTLVKKQNPPSQGTGAGSSEGFISNTIITTLTLITFVLCFIGIALIYLLQ